MQNEGCTIDDLRAILDAFERWTVGEDGSPVVLVSSVGCYGEWDEVVEFGCDNCGDYFTPKDRYDVEQREQAWRMALQHLNGTIDLGGGKWRYKTDEEATRDGLARQEAA